MTPVCKYCGAVLAPGNIYCLNCGKPVVPYADDEYETVVRQRPVETNRKYRVAIFILGALVIIFGASSIGLFLYMSRNPSTISPANVSVNAQPASTVPSKPSNQPETTPSAENTPAVSAKKSSGGTCTVTRETQIHDGCDTKDCDTDPSTLNGSASAGDVVTKLGRSVKSHRSFQWELVTAGAITGWVSSSSLSCETIAGDVTNHSVPRAQNNYNRIPNTQPKPDPWRGVPDNVRAICNDGTYSYTGIKLAQCSFHNGVRRRR